MTSRKTRAFSSDTSPVEPAIRIGDYADCWELLDQEEQEIAMLTRNGLTSAEISDELGISSSDIESVLETTCIKLGVKSPTLLKEVVSAFEF